MASRTVSRLWAVLPRVVQEGSLILPATHRCVNFCSYFKTSQKISSTVFGFSSLSLWGFQLVICLATHLLSNRPTSSNIEEYNQNKPHDLSETNGVQKPVHSYPLIHWDTHFTYHMLIMSIPRNSWKNNRIDKTVPIHRKIRTQNIQVTIITKLNIKYLILSHRQ